MPSSNTETAGSSKWIRQRVNKLLAHTTVQQKVTAITDLRDKRRYNFDLSRELTTFACMAVCPHQGRPAVLNRYWAARTGKTWKALAEFPTRLEKLADELEQINMADRHFYARRRGNDLSSSELQRLAQNCTQLPKMMRDYAQALRERNAAVSATTPRDGRSESLFQLSEVVKFLSGGYHDQEVSELLNAVAEVLGEQNEFDALKVAQGRSRRRKRSART